MRFRPCIDIHNGKVKQIVGGSLKDEGDFAKDNYVSEKDGAYYGSLYKNAGLKGGHIIILNPKFSPYYEEDVRQACLALKASEGTLQIGGGMTDENAAFFLEQGASHIIVTSFVFKDGRIDYENLKKICDVAGKEHLVLDLSCRKKDGGYYIVTDRWQKFTDVRLSHEILDELSGYCSEFLIHAVDVEGKSSGIEKELARMLGTWDGIPVTYAGGVSSYQDLALLKELGQDKIDVTIGSALDLFGGALNFDMVLSFCSEKEHKE
ncbi:MAG: phosphoribosylformimino-5-aminoimidazole carboxamide ribotide isomerase [Lachnospiraceae bacterium]|nr:phosphoribosylformimino-5-aminoimidazole carboxamide ribotide isomerase [Lachnospiraceae bacterium]